MPGFRSFCSTLSRTPRLVVYSTKGVAGKTMKEPPGLPCIRTVRANGSQAGCRATRGAVVHQWTCRGFLVHNPSMNIQKEKSMIDILSYVVILSYGLSSQADMCRTKQLKTLTKKRVFRAFIINYTVFRKFYHDLYDCKRRG